MHLNHKLLKGVGIALLVPFLLIFLLIVALYLPPVQRWAVDQAGASLGEKMGLKVSVGSIRLTPFLDLRLQKVTALDSQKDTILHTADMMLDVAFAPLFDGRADIEGFQLRGARIDTKSFVPDAHISGRVGELSAAAHGVAWKEEKVHLDRALLADADLQVTLSDTAKKDTTSAPTCATPPYASPCPAIRCTWLPRWPMPNCKTDISTWASPIMLCTDSRCARVPPS